MYFVVSGEPYRLPFTLILYHFIKIMSNDLMGKWENNSIFFEKNFLNKCSQKPVKKKVKINLISGFAGGSVEYDSLLKP